MSVCQTVLRSFSQSLVVLIASALMSNTVRADYVFNQLGDVYEQDFQDFEGTGLAAGGGAGTLDSNHWSFSFFSSMMSASSTIGGTEGSGLFGRGMGVGGETETGVYAYSTGGGNVALGLQLDSEGFDSGLPIFTIQNNTGYDVDLVNVSYDMIVFNHSDTASYADLEFTVGSEYTDPIFFDTPSLADVSPTWEVTPIEYTLFLPTASTGNFMEQVPVVANGESFDISLSVGILGGPGRYSDSIAIDNLRISLGSTAIPEPSSLVLFCSIGSICLLRRKRNAA
ncbi:PEP-CTERM sorting domain-containing protein [Rhodopirellula sp. MGV]|uniref:PEP-CTERM sorting domain-containing protein n=1 Tax=Rhodopirellula sp. MGV TaxID=2023130 RepID=UPI000B974D1B|nr:PEP-CTERM sorting domain-containing protein [Rhodopirellula sp. MGV]OYP36417.1 hypothetical protein CGZ80_08920 [Rhodopirellula sp. MGV]PNY36844.1 PEP-CTERM sorting domain-containing protein [Rhodopirellula baltica]